MKTVCAVVVVLLGLVAGGQSAPLSCQKVLKEVENGPEEITGKWYVIAISTEVWWYAGGLYLFLFPSLSTDITAKGPLNTYDAKINLKTYGYCLNDTQTFSFVNNGFLDGGYDEETGYPVGKQPHALLQTSCPDCLVLKDGEDADIKALMLLSRRTSVTAAEMEEFKRQAVCLGWGAPQVLNTDHDTENCKDKENEELNEAAVDEIITSFKKRFTKLYPELSLILTTLALLV